MLETECIKKVFFLFQNLISLWLQTSFHMGNEGQILQQHSWVPPEKQKMDNRSATLPLKNKYRNNTLIGWNSHNDHDHESIMGVRLSEEDSYLIPVSVASEGMTQLSRCNSWESPEGCESRGCWQVQIPSHHFDRSGSWHYPTSHPMFKQPHHQYSNKSYEILYVIVWGIQECHFLRIILTTYVIETSSDQAEGKEMMVFHLNV